MLDLVWSMNTIDHPPPPTPEDRQIDAPTEKNAMDHHPANKRTTTDTQVAPLWDSGARKFVGIMVITDFIDTVRGSMMCLVRGACLSGLVSLSVCHVCASPGGTDGVTQVPTPAENTHLHITTKGT